MLISISIFGSRNYAGDEAIPALASPDNWSAQASEILADAAAYTALPANLKPVEENYPAVMVVERTAHGRTTVAETSAQQIFGPRCGCGTYNGWKQDLFTDETEAPELF